MGLLIPTVNTLEEIYMIAGSTYELIYDAFDGDGEPLDMVGSTMKLKLSQFGRPNFVVLTKNGTYSAVPSNRFTVKLSVEDTKLLSGKYVQQPIITDYLGDEHIPGQGFITIAPRIEQDMAISSDNGNIII